MLQLSLIEVIFMLIPQSFILFFSFITFSFTKIQRKRFILSSILSGLVIYLIRLLPIQVGIHTLMIIPVYVMILNFINRVPLIKAISSIIVSIIVLSFCEMISVYFLNNVLNINVELAFQNVIVKTFCGYISMFLHLIIVVVFYFSIYKKKLSY